MKKQTFLWIIGIAVVLLLFIQAITSTYITIFNSTDWGIISRLPLTFWLGLSLLGVLLYVGRKSKSQTAVAVILIFLYLFVIPTIIVENKAAWLSISYYRSTQVDFIISKGYIPFNEISPWELLNWPGFFFISASLSLVTGLPTTWFAQFFPLLTLALIGIVAYAILKIKLNTIFSCLGALLVLACFYSGQQYFCPQAIAYIMFIAIILLTAKLFFTKSQNASIIAIILILFFSAVTTHLLTSFAILVAILVLYFFKVTLLRKIKLSSFFSLIICVLLASIFFLYQTLVIGHSFTEIIQTLYTQLIGGDSDIRNVTGISNRTIGSTAYMMEIIGTYGITLIMLSAAAISILILFYAILKRKPDAKAELFWIAWIGIAGVLGLSISYGGEGIIRAFMFMVIPVCYLVTKYLSKKPRILLAILFIIILIHFPAAYARENYLYVPTSEIKGATALAQYAPPGNTIKIFYENLAPMPFSLNERTFINIQKSAGLYSPPSSEIINSGLGQAKFVVSSSLQNNFYQYFFGKDILASYDLNQNQSRLYDNGEFTIFCKTAATP